MLKHTYMHTNCDLHLCIFPHCHMQTGLRAQHVWEFVGSFPTRLLKTLMSNSAHTELCVWFSMM